MKMGPKLRGALNKSECGEQLELQLLQGKTSESKTHISTNK